MHVLAQGLKRNGFTVTAYSDPLHALSSYKPSHFDLILLDIRMPVMTGFDLARKIWAKDPSANIIFISAFEIYENEAKVMLKDLKTVYFISKPITAKKLTEFIKQHLQN